MASEVRVEIQDVTVRFWLYRRDAIQASRNLFKATQGKALATYEGRFGGWIVRDEKGACYDTCGKLPIEIPPRSSFPRADNEFMGNNAVYPGHPVTIAFCIVHTFAAYEEAIGIPDGKPYPGALGDNRIPGAGGCVWGALDLLSKLRGGMDPTEAFQLADDFWTRTDGQKENNPERWQKGQDQADLLKAKLLEFSDWWAKEPGVLADEAPTEAAFPTE